MLERLGSVFQAFGCYLVSRADLIGNVHGAALTRHFVGEVMPGAAVLDLVSRELGRPVPEVFRDFEAAPIEFGLLHQGHRARLFDGQEVTVKIAPAGREESVADDLATLNELRGIQLDEEAPPLDEAIDDFCRSVRQQPDLVHEAKTWEGLAQDAEGFELLRVPRIFRELCGNRVLTLERLHGATIADLLQTEVESDCGLDRRDVAGRICTSWLRQALIGQWFPVDAWTNDTLIVPDGRVAFTGVHSSMPSGTRKDLWEYLLAAAAADPDKACTHLFRVMDKDPTTTREEGLRLLFRQAVPACSSRSFSSCSSGNLGELVLLHWWLAQSHGCRPPAHLLRFYRGFSLVHAAASRLAPDRDSLRDGLETIRMVTALGQMRDLMTVTHLNENLERYAPVLLELPRKLDEVLSLLASGSTRMHLHVRESKERMRRRNSTVVTTALLMALAAAALLTRHIAAVGEGDWAVKVGAIVVLVVGVVLLVRWGDSR
jgi:ubiquinone biosynthesis protein